jgi:hypothetical protein
MEVGYDGQYGTQSWPDHGEGNHAHINWGGNVKKIKGGARFAGGAAGPKPISLKGVKTNLKGVPGALAQRAMDAQKSGMEQAINKKIGAMGGAGAIAGGLQAYNHIYKEHNSGAGDWGGETLPFNVVAAIAEAAGLPGITFAQIAKGESGLRPGATGIDPGGTKGLGMWMITTGFNDPLIAKYGGQKQMLNPIINAKAAKEIYEGQGLGAWYGDQFVTDPNAHFSGGLGGGGKKKATGGRIPWFGEGADFIADRPQLIGVGDGGHERVQVTPVGRGGKGTVHVEHLTVNASDKNVRHEVEKALLNVARKIDNAPIRDQDELMT